MLLSFKDALGKAVQKHSLVGVRGGGDGTRGGGDGVRGSSATTAAGVDATASSCGEQHGTAPSEATAMDEETAMECGGDGGGGGASSSDGRQAARAMGIDVDELEVRVASETSARLATLEGESVGVKKPRRRAKGQKTHNQKETARHARERDGAGN